MVCVCFGSFDINGKEPTQPSIVSCVLLAHLAEMSMSLCNHELSVVWCHCHHCHLCYLWTVLPATGLITETSYLAHICTYAPSICTCIS